MLTGFFSESDSYPPKLGIPSLTETAGKKCLAIIDA